ncbi:MAG: hypothetical protein J3K34DRAFT_401606 [Monoraphidium minutum]|nr:MAG: hypothetical protein J3K34DRAFT_401606 [Monoraphidium minutum]
MDEVHVTDPPESDDIWYLGYGSMVNPESLRRRGVLPRRSVPVTLQDYDLEFSMNGMANIAARQGAVMHGIAHLVTPEMFEALAKIESVYDYCIVECRPYAPAAAPIAARAFIVPPADIARHKQQLPLGAASDLELPSQRYVRIIVEGLTHYGADPAWIARLRAQPFHPARQRADWLTVPRAPGASAGGGCKGGGGSSPEGGLKSFTLADLREFEGQLPAVYSIGRKVVRASLGDDNPFAPIYRDMLSGRQSAYFMVKNLYDPALPPVEVHGDLTAEHIAWAEDQAVETSLKYTFELVQIGVLVDGAEGPGVIDGPAPQPQETGRALGNGESGGGGGCEMGGDVPGIAAAAAAARAPE